MSPPLGVPLLQSPLLVLQMSAEEKLRGMGLGISCRFDLVAVRCKA